MKKQLRNLALASALLTAGAAFAASPVLELQWSVNVPTSASGSARFGVGYQGKLYFVDKGDKAIYSIDENGTKELYVQSNEFTGTGINVDEAGNFVVNQDFASGPSGRKFVIVDTEKNIHVCDFTTVDDVEFTGASARTDCFGRILGNVMSPEGGILYVAPNGGAKIATLFFQNGAVGDYSAISLLNDSKLSSVGVGGSLAYASPAFSTLDETLESGYANEAFIYRDRSSGSTIKTPSVELVGTQIEVSLETFCSINSGSYGNGGFEWFTLGGVDYVAVPSSYKAYVSSIQVVRVSDGVTVGYTTLNDIAVAGGATGQISVEKVDDATVDIYFAGYLGAVMYANKCTFSTKPVVYFDNTEAGWESVYAYCWNAEGNNVWPGVELTEIAADGTYKFSGFDEAYTSIVFNNGGNGKQTADFQLVPGQVYGLYYPHVYLIGHLTGAAWDPASTDAELTYLGNGIYEIDNVTFAESAEGNNTAYFSFITAAGSWDTANAYNRIGAETENEAIEGQANVSIQKGTAYSWKLDAYEVEGDAHFNYIYKLTLDVVNKTLTVGKTSGVKAVNVDANAPAVYYNLQGVQVENPQNGLFIVKRGNKVTKEIIR